jgi:hypothetical protein
MTDAPSRSRLASTNERDVLGQMGFRPRIADDLREMILGCTRPVRWPSRRLRRVMSGPIDSGRGASRA